MDPVSRDSASHRPPHRACRTLLVASATAIAVLGLAASPAIADTGSVYFDVRANAGAGDTLFNAAFTGDSNVGLAPTVMPNLTTGSGNTATGAHALVDDRTGKNNVAIGSDTLNFNKTGDANVAIGASGLRIHKSGSHNVALGTGADEKNVEGSNNVAIANPGGVNESGTIRIGTDAKQTRAFIAGIKGTELHGQTHVVRINANGQLGTGTAPSGSGGRSVAASVSRLEATVKRQQRQIEQQGKEIRELRAQRR